MGKAHWAHERRLERLGVAPLATQMTLQPRSSTPQSDRRSAAASGSDL